jgi:hypothetical protein
MTCDYQSRMLQSAILIEIIRQDGARRSNNHEACGLLHWQRQKMSQPSRVGSERVESVITEIRQISLLARDKILHSSDEMIYISGYSNLTRVS